MIKFFAFVILLNFQFFFQSLPPIVGLLMGKKKTGWGIWVASKAHFEGGKKKQAAREDKDHGAARHIEDGLLW